MQNPFSLSLESQLDSDEKLVKFLRPSRIAYFFHYVFVAVLFVVSIVLLIFGSTGTGGVYALYSLERWAGWILLALSLFFLARIEYRIFSRMYGITTERLLYNRGIFSVHLQSANYQYLTDIDMDQTFWDKIVECGNLYISTAGNEDYDFRYRKIRDPVGIKKIINDLQDEDRIKKGAAAPPIEKQPKTLSRKQARKQSSMAS